MIEFKTPADYERVRRSVVVPAFDFILGHEAGSILYVVRRTEPYKGVYALPGTTFRKPRAQEFATTEQQMAYVLSNELGMKLSDLVTKPIQLPGEMHWFDTLTGSEDVGMLRTSDNGEIRNGEAVFSIPVVAVVNGLYVNLNGARYSDWRFLPSQPDKLGALYQKHLDTYRRFGGSYDAIAERFSVK